MKKPRDHHDRHFRRLFSHPGLVRDLLRAHLPSAWSESLDAAQLTRYRETGVAPGLEKREEDLIWRVAWTDAQGDEQMLYVFVLLEFQRTVERAMAVRFMAYQALLYQDLLESEEIGRGQPLPAILPVVVYNGERPWTAPTRLEDLIRAVPDVLAPYRPRLRYLAIDLGRAHPVDDGNLFDLLGALERSQDADALQSAILRIARRLHDRDEVGLRDDLIHYIHHTAERLGVDADTTNTALEEPGMLRENVKRWEQEWREQGRAEGVQLGRAEGVQLGRAEGVQLGRAEGVQLGRAEGWERGNAEAQVRTVQLLRDLVVQQLEARFGLPASAAQARIEQADVETLQRWVLRATTAATVDEVLADD
ncbi:MAG: Rpn family recombination-promoting nuclease/putative transposase [Acidobacteriota bacterium]